MTPNANEEPLVSICCIAYNHERYIAQAIEGFLKQETDFKVEIIIHDDRSTDRTADIIRSYQQQHPHLIKTILQTENQHSQGKRIFPITFARARGKYFALCEGDDYWTDPLKLRKQVAVLEANPDYTFCFHPVDWLDQESQERRERHISPPVRKESYTVDDLLEHGNFIQTCSTVFRRDVRDNYPAWLSGAGYGDVALYLLTAGRGPVGFVDESMATYRYHRGGVWGRESYAIHLETLIRTFSLVGDRMRLGRRDSYRSGLTRFNLELHHVYLREREWAKAARAGWAALRAAPAGQRNYVLWTLGARFPALYLKHSLGKILKGKGARA